jgi:hypothetical protein
MGNAGSSYTPPTIEEDPYPGGEGRKLGVAISSSEECATCELKFAPDITTSTLRLSRNFGGVRTCAVGPSELKRVEENKLSIGDFLGMLGKGKYQFPLANSESCGDLRIPDEEIVKIKTYAELKTAVEKARIVRIRPQSEGFSTDTKAFFKPSLPFQFSFNGSPITVSTITVYHPCPLRVQDQQADAVISLNDPSASSTQIILIPIIAGDTNAPSAKFFNKLMNNIGSVAIQDPLTGQFQSSDIQTGNKWGLSQLFDTTKIENTKEVSVKNGFFAWDAMPALEKYQSSSSSQKIVYSWRPKSNAPRPLYVMLEKPLPVGSSDLRALTSSVPVTPWEDAIHPIGLQVVYKQGPPPNCGVPTRESMTDFSDLSKSLSDFKGDVTELSDQVDSCDPFLSNALSNKNSSYSTDKLLGILFNVFFVLAGIVGAYIAIAAVTRFYDVEYAEFTKTIGKVIAVGLKKLFGASAAAATALKNISELRKNPAAAAATALKNISELRKNPAAASAAAVDKSSSPAAPAPATT